MFNPQQYRDKAVGYAERGRTATGSNEAQKFKQLEKSFTTLADNEQWLHNNHQKTVRRPNAAAAGESLAEQEEHVLRCLGTALIMQWNTLPRKLQRELFDNASTMGDVKVTEVLRNRIARFLHKHKDDLPHGDPAAQQ